MAWLMNGFFLLFKKNWQIILLLVGGLFSFFLLRKSNTNFADRLKKIQDDHEKEIKKINEIREAERLQHKKNEESLKETLRAIQSQYEIQKKELDKKKKKEIEKIIKDHGDDPEELAIQLSNVTGFKVILPEKE